MVYKSCNAMCTDKAGKFLHASTRSYNYQMIIHKIDGNSTWVESTKDKLQGKMIKVRGATLLQMKTQGIVPVHQILDNEISEAYKQEIKDTNMNYQLVPPDNHRHNIEQSKQSKLGRTTL